MNGLIIRFLGTSIFFLCWLAFEASTSMGDEAQLKTVLFFVGNEVYDDDDMNKLKYQAEDAYRLWNKFIELNDVNVGRSKLLLSDDPSRHSGGADHIG